MMCALGVVKYQCEAGSQQVAFSTLINSHFVGDGR